MKVKNKTSETSENSSIQATQSTQLTAIADTDDSILKWVCDGLNETTNWVGEHTTLGIYLDHQLIAGIIFHDIRFGQDCWLTIYSTDKRWCSRRILQLIFGFAFDGLNCRRLNALVDTDNEKSIRLLSGIGFKKEGKLRQFRENGKDCFVYGLLETECLWRKKNE